MGSCANEGLCDLLISPELVYCLLVAGNPDTLIPSYQPHITDHFSVKVMLTGLTKTILHTLKETFSMSRVLFILEDIHHHQSDRHHQSSQQQVPSELERTRNLKKQGGCGVRDICTQDVGG